MNHASQVGEMARVHEPGHECTFLILSKVFPYHLLISFLAQSLGGQDIGQRRRQRHSKPLDEVPMVCVMRG